MTKQELAILLAEQCVEEVENGSGCPVCEYEDGIHETVCLLRRYIEAPTSPVEP